MPESIIRVVVFLLLTISTTALSTASLVLRLRQPDKNKEEKMLQENGVEEADFYSSPLDHLLTRTPERQNSNFRPFSDAGKLHLASKDGDLVDTYEKTRKVS